VRAGALILVVAGCLAAAAATASAQQGSRQNATLTFTETKPGTVTGLELRIDYINPADPAAKPPAVRRVVTELEPGGRYDTSIPGLCPASDPELMATGASACPAGSVVGEAVITIDTGIPGPGRLIVSDTTLLNDTGELIFLNTDRESGGRVVTRSAVGERTITTEAPMLPGSPPDGGAIDTVALALHPIASPAGNYITTPPECPDRGHWVNSVAFTYYDGVTQVVETKSPCGQQGQGAGGELRLKVRPRTVTAGEAVRFRFRLRGSEACRSGATIRFASETAHPDAAGRARIERALLHPGVRHPKVSSPGCKPAKARVRIDP
jgi:hypothetical protein